MIYHMIGSLLHTIDTRLFGNWILSDTPSNQKYINSDRVWFWHQYTLPAEMFGGSDTLPQK